MNFWKETKICKKKNASNNFKKRERRKTNELKLMLHAKTENFNRKVLVSVKYWHLPKMKRKYSIL